MQVSQPVRSQLSALRWCSRLGSAALAAKAAENGVQMEMRKQQRFGAPCWQKQQSFFFSALEVWNLESWFQRVAAHGTAEAEDHEETVAFRLR